MRINRVALLAIIVTCARLGLRGRGMSNRLRTAARDAFEENPPAALSVLSSALLRSKSATWSLLLLSALEQIEISNPRSKEMMLLLNNIPGSTAVDRLAFCHAVLRRCFSPLLVKDSMSWALEPSTWHAGSNSESADVGLSNEILNLQTDTVISRWVRREGASRQVQAGGWAKMAARLESSAQKGNLDAMYLLAIGAASPERRETMLLDVARLGSCEAQCALGVLYCVGGLTRQDQDEGEQWLKRAVDSGSETAKDALIRLEKTRGRPRGSAANAGK